MGEPRSDSVPGVAVAGRLAVCGNEEKDSIFLIIEKYEENMKQKQAAKADTFFTTFESESETP